MHGVEAFLALADVTGDTRWLQRALRMVQRLIMAQAAGDGYRVTEHFDAHWQPLPDYNRDNPADGFRPYGTTPAMDSSGPACCCTWRRRSNAPGCQRQTPCWLAPAGVRQRLPPRLARRRCAGAGVHPRLAKSPVVRERLHWVHAEASATAAALLQRTGDAQYEHWYRCFWGFIAEHFIDRSHGSWHHELDPDNLPGARIWGGKPDLYHALQACCCLACRWRQFGQRPGFVTK